MSDPYLNEANCITRLIREWEAHPQLIIAVDFDGTSAPFHDQHTTYDEVLQLIRECSELGFFIVLFTASDPKRYPEMRAYLEGKGIKVASVNENPIPLPFGKWGKVYFNILLDDRAGLASAYKTLKAVVEHVKWVKREASSL